MCGLMNNGCYSKNDANIYLLETFVVPTIQWNVLFSYPGRDVDWIRQNSVREKIVDIIKNTREELIIFIYGLTDEQIIDEIKRAIDRGVRVRIVADRERDYSVLQSKNIPYEIWRGGGLHHPKVMVSDRRFVFTGTGNFTTQGLLKDFDSYFHTEIYQENDSHRLLRMLDELGDPILQLGDMFFVDSPRNGVHIQKWILDSIHNSKISIKFMIYAHYDPVISWELIRAARRGVHVQGIYNRPINPEGVRLSRILPIFGSEILMEENEDRIDNGTFGLGGLLHHKTMLVDDRILLTGSYNYSRNARDFNREVFQITDNRRIIQEHIEEFDRVKSRSSNYKEELAIQNTQPMINVERNLDSSNSQSLQIEGGSKDSPDSSKVFYSEWGKGSFHSLGMFQGSNSAFTLHPISSGIFSFPLSSRRDLPVSGTMWGENGERVDPSIPIRVSNQDMVIGNENGMETLDELGLKTDWNQIQILTWNNRVLGGVEFRTNEDRDWGQVVFWTTNGAFYSVPLEKRDRNVYYAGLGDNLSEDTAGFLFFRSKSGVWDSIACYMLGNRSEPPIYRYYLIESFLRGIRLGNIKWRNGYQETCSRLRRSGD